MEKKYTPGPWAVHKVFDAPLLSTFDNGENAHHLNHYIVAENNRIIGDVAFMEPMSSCGLPRVNSLEEMEANAKLIAAAPELLEALQFCQSVIASQGMYDMSERMAYDKATEAIKKATEP